MSVASAAVLLLLVMDPLGNVPFFLSALKRVDPARQRRVVARELGIALRMIFPTPERSLHEDLAGEPFIVPLPIPYVTGPSAISTELLLTSREPGHWPEWLFALLLAGSAASVIVFFASGLRHRIDQRGLIAVERLMGMVVATISIQCS